MSGLAARELVINPHIKWPYKSPALDLMTDREPIGLATCSISWSVIVNTNTVRQGSISSCIEVIHTAWSGECTGCVGSGQLPRPVVIVLLLLYALFAAIVCCWSSSNNIVMSCMPAFTLSLVISSTLEKVVTVNVTQLNKWQCGPPTPRHHAMTRVSCVL